MIIPSRRRQRLIEVILRDGTQAYITQQALDVLLDHDCVLQFKRSNGWVVVGVDLARVKQPIRAKHTSDICIVEYCQERRASVYYCHQP